VTAPVREGVGARTGRPLLVLSKFSCTSGLSVAQTDRVPAASQRVTTAPYPSHEGVHGRRYETTQDPVDVFAGAVACPPSHEVT